jgi:hypothetical protein
MQYGRKRLGCKGVNWIHMTQDKDKWWVFVSAVMNILVP